VRFRLIVTDILSRTISLLLQLIVQILDTLHFWGLRAMYDDYLRLIGKRVVDFLLVLIELLSLGVTAEVLGANTGSKLTVSLNGS